MILDLVMLCKILIHQFKCSASEIIFQKYFYQLHVLSNQKKLRSGSTTSLMLRDVSLANLYSMVLFGRMRALLDRKSHS